MRIALAGLATSHPYADARVLARHAELAVWEPDPERLARFTAEHPAATVCAGLPELLDTAPDGVVLTVPTPLVAGALEPILELGVPVYVNKPAAATREQLLALDRLRPGEHVLTGSVLRFAPAFRALRVDPAEVLAVRVTVRHDVGQWARGHSPWQDAPEEGGGTLVTMGLHGVELLVALLGPDARLIGAGGAVRGYDTLRSEDTGLMALQWWGSGILGTVEILGVTDDDSYTVTVHTRKGSEEVVLHDDLGFEATVEAFLSMVGGAPSPVPWPEARAVLDLLISARESA
ncbi:Gfo/Idh/MocA family protein [Nonomuraea sp. NPDC050328]|uniref:Gfo/Idh/MocA family protein n=1 Tax=Nonomuraea sp. NPDC050328 TaxID=3364361 RepID=UPI0037B1E281